MAATTPKAELSHRLSRRQPRPDFFADLLAIHRFSGQFSHHRFHHLAHIFGCGGSSLGESFGDSGIHLLVCRLGGKIAFQNRKFCKLLLSQLITPALAK